MALPEPTPRRTTEVVLPTWLAERMFSCYYGAGPRFNEDAPKPHTPTEGTTPKEHPVPPPTIPANMHSLPATIQGLVGGGTLIPRGSAIPKPPNPQKG